MENELAWRLVDWAWMIVAAAFAWVYRKVQVWEKTMRRSEHRIDTLERDLQHNTQTSGMILKDIRDLSERLEMHRTESADRLEAFRRELRDDYRHLMDRILSALNRE